MALLVDRADYEHHVPREKLRHGTPPRECSVSATQKRHAICEFFRVLQWRDCAPLSDTV